ncbi:MAG: beta-glycosidase [Tannerella sp.]|jgi:hypothetical protein|nr:beta-glycosidase [Tannerella sp.]
MIQRSILLFLSVCLFFSCNQTTEREFIDLQGTWKFALDSLDMGEKEQWYKNALNEEVNLPGTTDTNKKGVLNTNFDETTFLSREYSYKGKAWYQKEIHIPANWEHKTLQLLLERTKPAKIWIDDTYIGSSRNISTSQVYNLTGKLTSGTHILTIMVDNGESVPPQLLSNSHAYTESTQTNWNGIIGKIQLEARPLTYIHEIQIYPDAKKKNALVKIVLSKPAGENESPEIKLLAEACNTDKKQRVEVVKKGEPLQEEVEILLDFGDNAVLWDEFDPAFYTLTVSLKGKGYADSQQVTFGLRDFAVKGTQFTMNDNVTFLRGKHDACVFPLTGHVAMDVESWRNYFKIAKSYGINHYRFHSWCPPEACFDAADLEGIYLQPELPYWGSFNPEDTNLIDFLTEEGIHIQKAYGNHASFVMFALGNELSGEQQIMTDLVQIFKNVDNRHIYATGSNNYLGFRKQAEIDDYFTTCRVGGEEPYRFNTHARGSFSFADAYDGGYINHTYPNSVMNFDTAVSLCPVPIISHETGQFQIYPNYKEMEKYTGVLKPRNFEIFKQRLEKAGMAGQADEFFKASGKWSVLLYRADIEMDIRTKGFGGFQLLDLQDYPGQGSAYVGILDAFMDSKELITPEEWREFCSEIVLLFNTPKFCYTTDEQLSGNILIANYSKLPIKAQQLNWELKHGSTILDNGSISVDIEQGVLAGIGTIKPAISSIKEASQVTLTLQIAGSAYKNSYTLWIYPSEKEVAQPPQIYISKKLDSKMQETLQQGGKVLWFPNHKEYEDVTVGGLFQTDYWNYRMFKTISERIGKPVSPGTMGILTNPEHPVFNHFPTDSHTNWQWFSMIKHSRPFILDQSPKGYLPIIQVIDNIERNHKLGILFEFDVNGGKLLVCMADLPAITEYPEARQLYRSILSYMESDKFVPATKLTPKELSSLFDSSTKTNKIEVLENISY